MSLKIKHFSGTTTKPVRLMQAIERACKKYYQEQYRDVGMDALCKVFAIPFSIDVEKRRILSKYFAADGYYSVKKYPLNVEVLIIGHKRAELVGGRYKIYDFHFRGATERDRKQFMLYAL